MNRTRGLLLAAVLLFSTFGGAALGADADADYKALLETWKGKEYVRALGLAEAFFEANPDFKSDSSLVGAARSWLARIDPDWTVDEHGIVAGYAGKYVDDVRFLAALAAVPGHVAAGYVGIERRLGVDLRGKLDLLLRFEDAGEREVDRGSTSTIASGGKPAEEILFRTEYVVLSPTDFRSRIRHEMKHAGFRKVVAEDFDGSSVCDDAAYWIARSFERQAREAYGVLLRDYSWATSVRKNVKGDWKAAGPVRESE